MATEYVFVDEWDVAAPPATVYDIVVDARTYPAWWKPVYLSVDTPGQTTVTAVQPAGRQLTDELAIEKA